MCAVDEPGDGSEDQGPGEEESEGCDGAWDGRRQTWS